MKTSITLDTVWLNQIPTIYNVEERAKLAQLFVNGRWEVTRAELHRLADERFHLGWLAEQLFPQSKNEQFVAYATAVYPAIAKEMDETLPFWDAAQLQAEAELGRWDHERTTEIYEQNPIVKRLETEADHATADAIADILQLS